MGSSAFLWLLLLCKAASTGISQATSDTTLDNYTGNATTTSVSTWGNATEDTTTTTTDEEFTTTTTPARTETTTTTDTTSATFTSTTTSYMDLPTLAPVTPQDIGCGSSVEGSTVGLPSKDLGFITFSSGDAVFQVCPNLTASYTFNACDSNFDTVLHLFTSGFEVQLGFNDDSWTCSGRQSLLTWTLTAGVCYKVLLEGWQQQEGFYRLAVSCSFAVVAPSTTTITTTTVTTTLKSWTPISCGDQVSGSTRGQPNLVGNSGGDQAYTLCTTFPGSYTFDVCEANYDTYLRVFTAGLRQAVADKDDGGCDTRQLTRLTVDLESGRCYDIVVEGWSSSEGEYNLRVECGTYTTSTLTTVTTTTTFTTGLLECGSDVAGSTMHRPNLGGDPAGDVSFEFCSSMTGVHTFDSCGTSFPSVLHVADHSGDVGVCRECGECGGGGVLVVTLEPGGCYTVLLGGVGTAHGDYRLRVTCPMQASGPLETLYLGEGSSQEYSNSWRGWYDRGHWAFGQFGKRATYDLLPLQQLNFSDDTGRFVVYNMVPPYTGMTLLQIVQACMPGEHHNNFSSAWTEGHCFPGVLFKSRGIPFPSRYLRIGVGDGQAAPGDWALFMLQSGNANGDFEGNAAYAFGSEGLANTGYQGHVHIQARASGPLISLALPRANLQCGIPVTGSTAGSADVVGNPAADAILEFCPTEDGLYAFSTCGSSFDTVLHIYLRGLLGELGSCDDCGPCGQQTVLHTHLAAGSCYDLVVEGAGQSQGGFQVNTTCCSRELHCSGKGEASAGWDGMSCTCLCDSGYAGTQCERCHDTTAILVNSGTSSSCEPCLPAGFLGRYVASAGSLFLWQVPLNTLRHSDCHSNLQASTRAADQTETAQQHAMRPDGTVPIQMPDCTADDAPAAVTLNLFLNDRFAGTVRCSPVLSCPATVAPTQSSDAALHLHFLDYRVTTAHTVLSALTPLRNLALDSRDEFATAPVNVSSPGTAGQLVTNSAELQALYNSWVLPNGPGQFQDSRTSCAFHAQDIWRLSGFAGTGKVRLFALAGDMPTCPEMLGVLQAIGRMMKVLWIGDAVMPTPYFDSIGVGARTFQRALGSNLASELCRLTEAKHRVSVPCGTGGVSFAPTQVSALQRPKLHLHGACNVEACCLGGTRRCSRLTDGVTFCYLPFAGEVAAQEVTLTLRDGSQVTGSQLLQTSSALPGLYATTVHTGSWDDHVAIQQNAKWLPGSLQAERCCQFVGVGLYDQTVMSLGQQRCWSVSAWWSSATITVGSIDLPYSSVEPRAFTQPVQTVAVRCHSPLQQGSPMVDGQSFQTDAAVRVPPNSSHLALALGIAIGTRQTQMDAYVAEIALREWVPQGRSLEAVRSALAVAGLRSHYPPEERPCGPWDVPDVEAKCHWAWCAEAKDAGPYLISAGFRAIPTDWSTSNAVRGDVVIIPPFTAVHSDTSAAVVNTMGDIAILKDDEGHWTSDNNMALTLLAHLHSISSSGAMPTLYRLREDVEVPPEPHEEFDALPLLKDFTDEKGLRSEFFAMWPDLDAEDGAAEQAEEMVNRHYPCPSFLVDRVFMPRELVEAESLPQAGRNFDCYVMQPTVGRPYGVRCCYSSFDQRYEQRWPSRILVQKPGMSDWWNTEEDGIERLAFDRSYSDGSCEGDPMSLPVQMARLAEGALRYKGSSSPSARTGGAVRAGWQFVEAVCGSSAGGACALLSRKGSDCAVAFSAPDTTSDWMGPQEDDLVTLVVGLADGLDASGIKVHGAMYRLAEEVIRDPRLTTLTAGCASVHFVGHGFGGAMASMAFLLRWNDPTVHLHTFGQPRILSEDSFVNINPSVCARVRRYVVQSGEQGCGDAVPDAFYGSGFKHFGEQWDVLVNRSRFTVDLAPQSCTANMPDRGLAGASMRFAGERFEMIGTVQPQCLQLHKLQRYIQLLEEALRPADSDFGQATCPTYESRRPAANATNMPFTGDFGWTPKHTPGGGWGDPHCRSYDGLDFECNFRGEAVWTQCDTWTVHVIAERHAFPQQATVLKQFAVRFDSDVVTGYVHNDGSFDLSLNGVRLSASESSSKLKVKMETASFNSWGNVISRGKATVEDVAGNIVEATFYSGLISLLVWPSETCAGRTSGLMGNSDGDPHNDLRAPDASQLHSNATAIDVYHAFVLKWCVTSSSASLFPAGLFLACDKSFMPRFLDVIPDAQLPSEADCQGNRRCLFDVAVGGSSLASPNLEGQRLLDLAVSHANHSGGWAPSFLEAPTWIEVRPAESEQLVMTFRAQTNTSTIVAFNCSSVCSGATARVHSVRCEGQNLISSTAALNLYARSLPAGRVECHVEDRLGRRSRSATMVAVEALPGSDATNTAATTTVIAQDGEETTVVDVTTSTKKTLSAIITSTSAPVTTVTATLELEVSTPPAAFAADANVKAGLAEGLARWTNVAPSAVQVELSVIENINPGNLRRLQVPNVRCLCTIAAAGIEQAGEVARALSPESLDDMSAQIGAALDEKTRPILHVISVHSVVVTSSPEAITSTSHSQWQQNELEDRSTIGLFLAITIPICVVLLSGCLCCMWRQRRLRNKPDKDMEDLRGTAEAGPDKVGSLPSGSSASIGESNFCDLTVEDDVQQDVHSAKFLS